MQFNAFHEIGNVPVTDLLEMIEITHLYLITLNFYIIPGQRTVNFNFQYHVMYNFYMRDPETRDELYYSHIYNEMTTYVRSFVRYVHVMKVIVSVGRSGRTQAYAVSRLQNLNSR